MKEYKLISTHPVKQGDLGFHGNLFGGYLLQWVDLAGASAAAEYCDTPNMVTRSISACEFKNPAKEGQIVKIYAKVNSVGNTSITLDIEARAHNVYSGIQKILLSTSIVFVRIDEYGEKLPISLKVKNKFNNIS